MISIIICSRTADISNELRQNIATTIGCEYELCVIDNSRNEYSIFTAYNEGVRRAKGDILCFMHDDILFHTDGWGKILSAQFEDKSIGIIGFAGTHFLSSSPQYWCGSPFISQCNMDNGQVSQEYSHDFFQGPLADVVAVDGLCMIIRKSLFGQVQFDDTSYSGFHAYDMDICMQVQQMGYRICVSRSILVEHLWSVESFNDERYMRKLDDNMQIFCKKWQSQLPIWRGGPDLPEYSKVRINRLCAQAYDARLARQSKSYRIGRFLIAPFRKLKALLKS